jgi:ankyrin repeat protein
MFEYLGGLPDEKVRQLKRDVDKWLREHPGAQKASLERIAKEAALHQSRDAEEIVSLLLAAKADPNAANPDNGQTPLDIAISGDRSKMLLLASGANPNLAVQGGNTPLSYAISAGREEMVKVLLAAKADPNLAADKWGQAPLHIAADQKNSNILTLLLAAGANSNAERQDGATALYIAVERNQPAMVKILLAAHADPDFPGGRDAETALHNAVQQKETECMKLLLAAKANPNVSGGYYNVTPLYYAAQKGDLEAVRLLLAAKADPNAVDEKGKSVFDVSADSAVESALKKAGGKSKKPDTAALYDELGWPMNKAAEEKLQKRESSDGEDAEGVDVLLNSPAEEEAFSETIAQGQAGHKSPYLTRAVLMGESVEELAERVKSGQDVNGVDPMFGRPLLQALEQRRCTTRREGGMWRSCACC